MNGRRESLSFPSVPDIGATPSQIQKWEAEDAYNRMFGYQGHADTAKEMAEKMAEAARECHITGINGAISLYNFAMMQMRGVRDINRTALNNGTFSADRAGEYAVRIREMERRITEQLEAAILQGCPCAKP